MFESFTGCKNKIMQPLYMAAYKLNPNYDQTLIHPDQEVDILNLSKIYE